MEFAVVVFVFATTFTVAEAPTSTVEVRTWWIKLENNLRTGTVKVNPTDTTKLLDLDDGTPLSKEVSVSATGDHTEDYTREFYLQLEKNPPNEYSWLLSVHPDTDTGGSKTKQEYSFTWRKTKKLTWTWTWTCNREDRASFRFNIIQHSRILFTITVLDEMDDDETVAAGEEEEEETLSDTVVSESTAIAGSRPDDSTHQTTKSQSTSSAELEGLSSSGARQTFHPTVTDDSGGSGSGRRGDSNPQTEDLSSSDAHKKSNPTVATDLDQEPLPGTTTDNGPTKKGSSLRFWAVVIVIVLSIAGAVLYVVKLREEYRAEVELELQRMA